MTFDDDSDLTTGKASSHHAADGIRSSELGFDRDALAPCRRARSGTTGGSAAATAADQWHVPSVMERGDATSWSCGAQPLMDSAARRSLPRLQARSNRCDRSRLALTPVGVGKSWPKPGAHRDRQHGADRGRRRPLLGRADAALAAALSHRHERMPRELIHALATIKKAAALVNRELGLLARRQVQPDRRGRRRGDRGQARRRVPARRCGRPAAARRRT